MVLCRETEKGVTVDCGAKLQDLTTLQETYFAQSYVKAMYYICIGSKVWGEKEIRTLRTLSSSLKFQRFFLMVKLIV